MPNSSDAGRKTGKHSCIKDDWHKRVSGVWSRRHWISMRGFFFENSYSFLTRHEHSISPMTIQLFPDDMITMERFYAECKGKLRKLSSNNSSVGAKRWASQCAERLPFCDEKKIACVFQQKLGSKNFAVHAFEDESQLNCFPVCCNLFPKKVKKVWYNNVYYFFLLILLEAASFCLNQVPLEQKWRKQPY